MLQQIPPAIPEVHEHENQDEEANDNDGEDEGSPDKPDEDHDVEGETLPEPDTTATSSSSRGEKRTETQENVFVKRRLMTKSQKRPITHVPPPEDPVKRRLVKKTDLRNDEVVMDVDEHFGECGEHAHEGRDRAGDESRRRQRDAEVDGS